MVARRPLADGLQVAGDKLKVPKKSPSSRVVTAPPKTTSRCWPWLITCALPAVSVFGGSWLPVGEADGIARSGDPVANRKAVELLDIADNLDEPGRARRPSSTAARHGNDLFKHEQAEPLKQIASASCWAAGTTTPLALRRSPLACAAGRKCAVQ